MFGTMIALLLVHSCYGQDLLAQQLITRIDALEKKVTEQNAVIEQLQQNPPKEPCLCQPPADTKTKIEQLTKTVEKHTKDLSLKGAQIHHLEKKIFDLKFEQVNSGQNSGKPEHVHTSVSRPSKIHKIRKVTGESVRRKQFNSTGASQHIINDERSFVSRRLLLDSNQHIAFHAVVDGDEVSHNGVNQHVVFGKVLLNLGSGYHPDHGTFIAPASGLYLFSVSVNSFWNSHAVIHASLVKEGNILARIIGEGASGTSDQGSATVVTELNTGEEVWVNINCCTDGSFFGQRRTTFSGVLLK